MAGSSVKTDGGTRDRLATRIVGVSVAGVVALSAILLLTGSDSQEPENARLVFTAVLPLLGTWVGTVLAFYFARENFQAATESTLRLTDRGPQNTSAKSSMIPASDIVAYDLAAGETVEDVKLADLKTKMTGSSPVRRRLPIRDGSGAVLYVVHDATLLAYAQSGITGADAADATFGQLLDSEDYKALVKALGFVPENATLAQARAKMAAVNNCNDVFVTATGKPDEKALGWLTNTTLAGID